MKNPGLPELLVDSSSPAAEEEPVQVDPVQAEIRSAFSDSRAFPFYVERNVVRSIRAGATIDSFRGLFVNIKNITLASIAEGDSTTERRLKQDAWLSSRLCEAIALIHQAVSELQSPGLETRRYCLIRERPGYPTIAAQDGKQTEISHVGQGPDWLEIPTIYLGLYLFHLLAEEERRRETTSYPLFLELLRCDEQAVEAGYVYSTALLRRKRKASVPLIDILTDQLVERPAEYERARKEPVARELAKGRIGTLYRQLDARLALDVLNYNSAENLKAIDALEKSARLYRKRGPRSSLLKVVRMLVSASGHDVHEVRNRANLALERIFSPKEYDAPPATSFVTVYRGAPHTLHFSLPRTESGYFLRLYSNEADDELLLESELSYVDIPLEHDEGGAGYRTTLTFDSLGFHDYVVFRRSGKRVVWLSEDGMSGRINVVNDVTGEVILQIFPDIHGHTKAYWNDADGHPGMVYNERGEIIRLGRFSDITAHLQDLKERYHITGIYLLGVQQRGENREDWAPEASSPSPFSPMSLTTLEPRLGGEQEFKELVERAHGLGIKIIVDVMPHLNRTSEEVPEEWSVHCYDDGGHLVVRASTDGRYGSWNDGKLLNYRIFEVWQWLAKEVETLVERYDIDGIRFDTAHAVPIMMKKNNFPFVYDRKRTAEEMVRGTIVSNDREDDHLVTTGYYDSACRDTIAVPFQTFLMRSIEQSLRHRKKSTFLYLAECYWGRERYLVRSGVMPYNISLFKICEDIVHGVSDVREIYHLYEGYYSWALTPGTEMVGILGNHDERRALNTFGPRGVRAAVALTSFMSNMLLDYEGNAEGESWKVFMDNIYVNWLLFEEASHRTVEGFYRDLYAFHRRNRGRGYLVWAENNQVAAALKVAEECIWIGIFNFSQETQHASIHFDNPAIPIDEAAVYRLVDPVYSPVTQVYGFYSGRELRVSKVHTVVNFTDRVKILRLEPIADSDGLYPVLLRDSIARMKELASPAHFLSSFAYGELARVLDSAQSLSEFVSEMLLPQFQDNDEVLELGLKRACYYLCKNHRIAPAQMLSRLESLAGEGTDDVSELAQHLNAHNRPGASVFISAESEPFSKSGGLGNVVYELPRELAKLGEEVYVITPYYRFGTDAFLAKLRGAAKRCGLSYTGKNVRFFIEDVEYEIGVHSCQVEGVTYFLLDHHEFCDGLYWGVTGEEKLRRRIALSRASAEIMVNFHIDPLFVFTNDAYAGIFNGIVRSDSYYASNPCFRRTSFFHIVHNGGWQYFDSYYRYENGRDLFRLFNLPYSEAGNFSDPDNGDLINCMAAGIRYADRCFTVSPSYALQLKVAGDGLEKIISNVIGINNAIGHDFADRARQHLAESSFVDEHYEVLMQQLKEAPEVRHRIKERFPEVLQGPRVCESIKSKTAREIATRTRNKLLLQAANGLIVDPDIPLVMMLHRVADQKGFQLLLEASEGILKDLGVQVLAGGPVNWDDGRATELADGLSALGRMYPGSVAIRLGFQDVRIPLLCADAFLMPSRHEPGGISQLEAFACGCLVVARATGGLRDTVFALQIRGKRVDGNGVLFTDYTSEAFYDAMQRFTYFYRDASDLTLHRARENAARSAYYWDRPARTYLREAYGFKEIIRPGI